MAKVARLFAVAVLVFGAFIGCRQTSSPVQSGVVYFVSPQAATTGSDYATGATVYVPARAIFESRLCPGGLEYDSRRLRRELRRRRHVHDGRFRPDTLRRMDPDTSIRRLRNDYRHQRPHSRSGRLPDDTGRGHGDLSNAFPASPDWPASRCRRA